MKKLITVLVFLCIALGAAYCGASWWVGTQAQKQYEVMLDQKIPLYLRLPKDNPYLQVSNRSYERGIFHSTAVTSVVLNLSNQQPMRFLIENSIQHGPLAFAKGPDSSRTIQPAMAVISTNWSSEGEAGDAIKAFLDKVPDLRASEIITILKLDGSGESYLKIPAFKKTAPGDKGQDLTVDWGGFEGKSRFDILQNQASGSFSVPAFDISDPEQQLTMKSVTGNFDIRQGAKGFATGDVSVACEQVEFKNAGVVAFSLQTAMLREASWFVGEAVNASLTARLEKLTAAGMAFGPFVFELELRKLDADALARLQQKVEGIQAKLFAKSAEEALQDLSPIYKQFLVEILSKSPEMEIKQLKAATPWGGFDARFSISVSESGGLIVENPLAALASVSASLDASVSEQLLSMVMESGIKSDIQKEDLDDPAKAEKMAGDSAREIIQGLIAQNLIVRDNQNLKANATYRPGKLEVNGKPLNLQDMLQ